MLPKHITRLALLILFLLAFALLSVGISEPTGVTGKDEYYLALRTPLCMQEQQVWLIPCLDGQPRLRKPPLLYWLTRASLELFGTSLGNARLIATSFAALLTLAIAMLTLELGYGINSALTAGLIALSYLSLAISGRILEHDIPVAAWSSLALVFLLRWYNRQHWYYTLLTAICLAAGFLTKGPIVFIIYTAGIISFIVTNSKILHWFQKHWIGVLTIILLTTILTVPWFIYTYYQYPTISAELLVSEMQDRKFPYFSLVPVYGLLLLALPWSFIGLNIILHWRHLNQTSRQLILWLGLTLLPFFFIRSFERYLFGSLVPFTVLLANFPFTNPGKIWNEIHMRTAARIGLGITLLAALLIHSAALILSGPAPWILLTFPSTIWFTYQWWQARRIEYMALSAALLWTCTIGLAYPRLGINQIPKELINQVQNQEIVFFNGPQPGLLPALLGRSLVHVDEKWHLPQRLRQSCAEFWLLSEEVETNNALIGIKTLKLVATEQGHFGIFSSRVTWANMFRSGVTLKELWTAATTGNLTTIMPQVWLYQVRNPQCPKLSNISPSP